MHQIDGLCFLIFAERGLWNRFVPSLDGYIQDRLNNPVHVPKHGTVKALRLEAPAPDLVRCVVEARLRPCLGELPRGGDPVPDIYPFADEQVARIARTEPTLRDMLQQFRHLFDHIIYGPDDPTVGSAARRGQEPGDRSLEAGEPAPAAPEPTASRFDAAVAPEPRPEPVLPEPELSSDPTSRIAQLLGHHADDEHPPAAMTFKHVDIVETPADGPDEPAPRVTAASAQPAVEPPFDLPAALDDVPMAVAVEEAPRGTRPAAEAGAVNLTPLVARLTPDAPAAPEVPALAPFPVAVPAHVPAPAVVKLGHAGLVELWDQECRSARRKLEPEGALTGATRELQAGLGALLGVCHEHGVKVGPWRLQHVVDEWSYGDHPTYGVVTIAHWACKDGQPWRMGLGLFLARGAGKPKDLEVKLAVLDTEPAMVDLLVLLRPEDDYGTTGKSKTLLQESERRGRHTRLEPIALDGFAQLYAFPRWLAAVREGLPDGTPLPNLADVIQEKCEKILEQVCMPVQG
jgi:hypothetical protein